MAEADRARWEGRYEDGDWADLTEPARIVRDAAQWLEPPGVALDAACGAGRNALHLARLGYSVIAVDISRRALDRLRSRARAEALDVRPVHADLGTFALPDAAFDLIVNTRFLLRSLFPIYRRTLRPGGLLLFETYHVDEIEVLGGDIRHEYVLERDELRQAFADFEILLYREGIVELEEGERGLARMIARKPKLQRPS